MQVLWLRAGQGKPRHIGLGRCRWLPVWLPELAIFDLFMALNCEPVRVARGTERLAPAWPVAADTPPDPAEEDPR